MQSAFECCAEFLSESVLPTLHDKPCVVGVCGPQGSGKTTLVQRLACQIAADSTRRVETLSLDDFYLTRERRQQLAREIHPLFRTRGVPGTHDTAWIVSVLDALVAGHGARVPRFDKATDDRAAEMEFRDIVGGPVDLILIEGWCLGLPAQPRAALELPVNQLERERDPDAVWRSKVNEQLAGPYRQVFSRIDRLIALMAPRFEVVREWRGQQEQALLEGTKGVERELSRLPGVLANDADLGAFVAHFERLTRHGLQCWPEIADLTLFLDAERALLRAHPRR